MVIDLAGTKNIQAEHPSELIQCCRLDGKQRAIYSKTKYQ